MTETKGTRESCTCAKCQRACTHKPGWYAPGEIEKTAAYLGVPLAELFKTKLAVDFYYAGDESGDGTDHFAIAPAIVGSPAGTYYPFAPTGTCVFYVEGRCSIHPAKPSECRDMLHDEPAPEGDHLRRSREWDAHRAQITELLGSEPAAPHPTLGDVMEFAVSVLDQWSGALDRPDDE